MSFCSIVFIFLFLSLTRESKSDFLAMLLGTSSRRVQVWFQNHRVGNAHPLFSPPYVIESRERDETKTSQLEAMQQHDQRFKLVSIDFSNRL